MDIFLNFGFAWISVFVALFLAAAYLTRKALIKFPKAREFFIKTNKKLRKYHKYIGIALILTGLIHGLFSSEEVWTINLGTISWLFSILLGLSFMFRKKLTGKKNWMYFHRILVVIFSLSIIIHVVDVGGIQVFNVIKATNNIEISETVTPTTKQTDSVSTTEPEDPTESAAPTESPAVTIELPDGNVYKDGTYVGEATGYRDGLVVTLEIKDNTIISVEVTDHNEVNSRFWKTPVEYLPKLILQEQNTEVDTVSGATFTSVGIINAAKDALRQALASGEVSMDLPLPTKRRR